MFSSTRSASAPEDHHPKAKHIFLAEKKINNNNNSNRVEQTSTLTFIEKLIFACKSTSRPGIVRLEDELEPLVHGDDWMRDVVAAQSIFEVHHVVGIDREYVDVVEQAPAHTRTLKQSPTGAPNVDHTHSDE